MTDKSSQPGSGKRSVIVGVASVAAFVVLLAIIMLVIPALSPHQSKSAEPPQGAELQKAASVETTSPLDEARAAITSGDASRAVGLLTDILAKNPNDTAARALLESAKKAASSSSSNSSSNSGASGSTTAKKGVDYSSAVKNVKAYLPGSVPGFTAGTPQGQAKNAVAPYDPAKGSAAEQQMRRAVFEVHDRGSAGKASSYLDQFIKTAYSKDASPVKVNSVKAYFGTDGSLEAVVAFTRGRFVFVMTSAGQPGVKPASLKTLATTVAGSFPASN